MIRTEALDFPKSILIETCNLCQGECKFCPYYELRRNDKLEYLDSRKIIELIIEISKHKIERLTLFNNNEPLLDKRICEFVSFAHKLMPNVEITLSTNGRVLDKKILEDLLESGLTTLYVSIPCVNRENYAEVMGIYPDKVFKVLDDITDEKLLKMIRIAVPITKYYNEEINKRFEKFKVCAWNLEYKASWNIKEKFDSVARSDSIAGMCDRPMDQAVISSNGDVLICCRDWQGENIVGNVYKSSLIEIWQGAKMQEIQRLIAIGEYEKIDCCKDCAINRKAFKR